MSTYIHWPKSLPCQIFWHREFISQIVDELYVMLVSCCYCLACESPFNHRLNSQCESECYLDGLVALLSQPPVTFYNDLGKWNWNADYARVNNPSLKIAGFIFLGVHLKMLNPSYVYLMQVKYLQIAKKSRTTEPYRWVRYVTQANSYVARLWCS